MTRSFQMALWTTLLLMVFGFCLWHEADMHTQNVVTPEITTGRTLSEETETAVRAMPTLKPNIPLLTLSAKHTKQDVHWLALNIYHEARGEGREGMRAVGWVTINRTLSNRFPNTISAVVTQGGERRNRCQFSWWCDGRSDKPGDQKRWGAAQWIAEEILSGHSKDNTGVALFYYNPKIASPCWEDSSSSIKMIGNHQFFGDIPWEEMRELCLPGRQAGLFFLTKFRDSQSNFRKTAKPRFFYGACKRDLGA